MGYNSDFTGSEVEAALRLAKTSVQREAGKGLSTNDYTKADKDKLAGIEDGAQVNVQADWNATTGSAVILNKPTIPAAVTESTVSGWGFTKNAVTGVTINGAQQTPSGGVVNLGNFLSLNGGAMNNTAVVTNLNADLLDGYSGSAYAKKEDLTGLAKVNAESAGVICAKTRLRVNTSDSTTVFAYMDVAKYGTANNIATAHIGSCYGGNSTVTSTGEYPDGQSMTAISMYRGRVGIGRRWTDTEIRALHDANVSLGVANNARIEGTLTQGSDVRFKDTLENKVIALNDIVNAPLFTFKWNNRDDNAVHLGSSAQYWEEIVPWLVAGDEFKSLDYSTLGTAIGISLARIIDNQRKQINELRTEIDALKKALLK